MLWDVFCRVVDNFGDIGVCWRLSADLASRGEIVRLRVDDASALAWMAPGGCPGVSVLPYDHDGGEPGDAVVEAFGCDPPPRFLERMAARSPVPVWVNLEYLSAESYVERSHGLPSPVLSGPARGLVKWFYFPGFTERTGGLLRERALLQARDGFDGDAWLRARGLERRAGERVVSLFCYPQAPVGALLRRLGHEPTLLLATAGAAAQATCEALGAALQGGALRAAVLPLLAQREYDELLWACDLNLVRGEDSFVRAQWAARPFVWQAYPQDDGAHGPKVVAFLDRMLRTPPAGTAGVAADLRGLWLAWNRLGPWPARLPEARSWKALARGWCARLAAAPDLATQLQAFVSGKR